jgi:hypothetical protein
MNVLASAAGLHNSPDAFNGAVLIREQGERPFGRCLLHACNGLLIFLIYAHGPRRNPGGGGRLISDASPLWPTECFQTPLILFCRRPQEAQR